MTNQIQLLRNQLERQKGRRLQIEQSILQLESELEISRKSLILHEQAKEIIRTVGQKTQNQLSFHISDLVSMALDAVFPDPYEMKVDFVQRRNKTECDLSFVRGDMEIDPMTASGVGAVDIASFALRIASWSMMRPRTSNTIILDEPFKFLSENYQELASAMLKEISQKLGIQFIIVSHEPILAEHADKIFKVSINKGKSKVE